MPLVKETWINMRLHREVHGYILIGRAEALPPRKVSAVQIQGNFIKPNPTL
jgi:hypothetical protein